MNEDGTRTFVFDLDGTICEQTSGGAAYADAAVRWHIAEIIRKLHAAGNRIVIYTARGMGTYDDAFIAEVHYRNLTKRWLRMNEIPWDELVFGKPAGDVYIDDKGVHPDQLASWLNTNER